jgi:hypothetical protein
MPFYSSAFAAMASPRPVAAGSSCPVTFTAAAMCIAEGNVSFDDCDMFHGRRGHRCLAAERAVPASHIELRATAGHPHMQRKHVVVQLDQDLVADLHDQPVSQVVQPPARVVGVGAAFFSVAYAVIISRGIRCCPMLRCSSERWVCAPPQLVCRHLDLAETVGFSANLVDHFFLPCVAVHRAPSATVT